MSADNSTNHPAGQFVGQNFANPDPVVLVAPIKDEGAEPRAAQMSAEAAASGLKGAWVQTDRFTTKPTSRNKIPAWFLIGKRFQAPNEDTTMADSERQTACSPSDTGNEKSPAIASENSTGRSSAPPPSSDSESTSRSSANPDSTANGLRGLDGSASTVLPLTATARTSGIDSGAKMDLDNPEFNKSVPASRESAESANLDPHQTPSLTYQSYAYGTSPHSWIFSQPSSGGHQPPFASRSGSLQSDAEAAASTTTVSNQQNPAHTTSTQTTDTHDPNRFDLLPRIKGLCRLLDLYSETGGGGLVDKIIISQESLGQFINSVLPGAYTNVTKIDFARLDREASLRLVGIYGSKSEIVQFLHSLGSIDDEIAALLLVDDDVSVNMRPSLRSGIYVLSPAAPDDSLAEPLVRYVVYWPEETTWNDDAAGSVRKNRVTFMRYLTSLTDQIRALISPEHEAKLVFKDTDQVEDSDEDGFDMSWNDFEAANVDDRLFKFEVAKTNEQAEAVNIRPGFTVRALDRPKRGDL